MAWCSWQVSRISVNKDLVPTQLANNGFEQGIMHLRNLKMSQAISWPINYHKRTDPFQWYGLQVRWMAIIAEVHKRAKDRIRKTIFCNSKTKKQANSKAWKSRLCSVKYNLRVGTEARIQYMLVPGTCDHFYYTLRLKSWMSLNG